MVDLVVDSFNNCFLDHKKTAVRSSAHAIMVDLVVGSFNNCFLDHKQTAVRSSAQAIMVTLMAEIIKFLPILILSQNLFNILLYTMVF